MANQPPIALAALTALELPPPEMIALAKETGYDRVGLRLIPVGPGGIAYDLMHDRHLLEATLSAIDASGVSVGDLEIAMLRPDTDVSRFLPFLEAGQRIGARHVLVAGYDAEEARLIETFSRFADAAAAFGLTADLEFMPWSAVKDLAAAIRVVAAADRPNAGILVDPLHFDRSASRLSDLGRVRSDWLHYWQLCDAPVKASYTTDELLTTARAERLFPGEGEIDLVPLINAMPAELPISLEIPTAELAKTVGAAARARRAMGTTKALLARVRGIANGTE